MFYCNNCADKRGWPTNTLMQSRGPCEICETVKVCNDLPSSRLPLPKQNATKKGN